MGDSPRLIALALLLAACADAPPPAAPRAPAPDPAPPVAGRPEPAAGEPVASSPPDACDHTEPFCLPAASFADEVCRGQHAELALHFFGPKTPWKRAYVLRAFKAWHVGSRSDMRELKAGEEVILLTGGGKGGAITDAGRGFDALRWDGTCVSLMEDELSFRKPPSAVPANIDLKALDPTFRSALVEERQIEQASSSTSKMCEPGKAEKEPARSKCEMARRQLSQLIAQTIGRGKELPPLSRGF